MTRIKRAAAPVAPPPPPPSKVSIGVYTSSHRETALVFKHTDTGLWYLSMKNGFIEHRHCGEEKFLREFPYLLPAYPIRKAIKVYHGSLLRREPDTQKIMERLIERM